MSSSSQQNKFQHHHIKAHSTYLWTWCKSGAIERETFCWFRKPTTLFRNKVPIYTLPTSSSCNNISLCLSYFFIFFGYYFSLINLPDLDRILCESPLHEMQRMKYIYKEVIKSNLNLMYAMLMMMMMANLKKKQQQQQHSKSGWICIWRRLFQYIQKHNIILYIDHANMMKFIANPLCTHLP